jgi:hypothetical protein
MMITIIIKGSPEEGNPVLTLPLYKVIMEFEYFRFSSVPCDFHSHTPWTKMTKDARASGSR